MRDLSADVLLPPVEVLEGWLSAGDPGECPLPVLDECAGCCCGECVPPVAMAHLVDAEDGAPDRRGQSESEPEAAWAVPGVPLAGGPVGPAVSPLVGQLSRALDAVQEHGPLSGSRADTAALLALAERARGLALREVGEMEATGGHQVPGAGPITTSAWLRAERHLTDGSARSTVRLARELRTALPEVGELLLAGEVTLEHASAVVGGVAGLDPALVAEAAGGLCALAQVADPTAVRRRLRDMACAVDDRLGAEAERHSRERMGLRLAQVGAHTAVDGTLAGDDGATVRLAMALAVEAARSDGDTRGKAARQADVLVQWATQYLDRAAGPGDSLAQDVHTVRSHLLITCTPEQLAAAADGTDPAATGLHPAGATPANSAGAGPSLVPATASARTLAELLARDAGGAGPASAAVVGDDTPLSRGALRRLACDATLSLIVQLDPTTHQCQQGDGPAGAGARCPHLAQPLHVGRSARTLTGVQFKALVVRDRTCVVTGCHRPPAQCAGHHVRHWADGGLTDLDNLVLLCHQHHHDHHDRGQDLPHHDGQRWLTQSGWAHAPT